MNANLSPVITATLVPENKRLHTLPTHFGSLMMIVENRVYDTFNALSPNHGLGLGSGYWHYYELSNGGWYMAPASDKRFTLMVEGNGYQGEMSADAAGITVSLFALNHLANELEDDGIINHYYWLKDYIAGHAERSEIWEAID